MKHINAHLMFPVTMARCCEMLCTSGFVNRHHGFALSASVYGCSVERTRAFDATRDHVTNKSASTQLVIDRVRLVASVVCVCVRVCVCLWTFLFEPFDL